MPQLGMVTASQASRRSDGSQGSTVIGANTAWELPITSAQPPVTSEPAATRPGPQSAPSFEVCGIPSLSPSTRIARSPATHDPNRAHLFRYRSRKHSSLPHVVKFSGGRSSGMLLFTLLHNGLLRQDRGDVIVFNNTAAEHPGTYEFVGDCIRAAHRYGIPFFQIEFQTYEDARQGEWTRLPTYRLVNENPRSASNPNGFHWQGEVFEELLSWSGYVPNQFQRICTRHLKLEVTRAFLRDWFSGKPGIPRMGHFGRRPRMNPDAAYRRHLKNQGGVPREIFLEKRRFAWERPHFRPEQRFEDYWPDWTPFENEHLKGKTFGGKARFGKGGAQYVAFIGLRHDEPHRVQRVSSRNDSASGYEGEHIYMPLADMAVAREDVNRFWEGQTWDLKLPHDSGLSNCVYCFLKGAVNLRTVHAHMTNGAGGNGAFSGTPCDLAWWKRMEAKYGRDLEAEKRATRSKVKHIGFFGNNDFSYDDVANGRELGALAETMLPCDCTE